MRILALCLLISGCATIDQPIDEQKWADKHAIIEFMNGDRH